MLSRWLLSENASGASALALAGGLLLTVLVLFALWCDERKGREEVTP